MGGALNLQSENNVEGHTTSRLTRVSSRTQAADYIGSNAAQATAFKGTPAAVARVTATSGETTIGLAFTGVGEPECALASKPAVSCSSRLLQDPGF